MIFCRIYVDDIVELQKDIPDRDLKRGERGKVVSIWFSPPSSLYEVNFPEPEITVFCLPEEISLYHQPVA